MKTCPKCKEKKPDSGFYKNPNTGLLHTYCRECMRNYQRDYDQRNRDKGRVRCKKWRDSNPENARESLYRWRAKNPDKIAAIYARWYEKNQQVRIVDEQDRRARTRQEVFKAYGGFVCACCGEDEPLFMTIDHINNDGASHRRALKSKVGKGGSGFFQWLKANNFPSGYQVLCRNCNWGKHANGGVCPHVTSSEGSTTIPAGSRAKQPEARSTVLADGDDIVSSA